MEHKISIIVPAYNVEAWLGRCVDSILAQTYPNLEVLLIDDGSTDDTADIIDRYARQDSRVVAVHQKNAGLVAVREKGIALASGDFVGFVDGDDAVDTDMYERLLHNALEVDAQISHCGLKVFYPYGRLEPHYGTGRKAVQTSQEALQELMAGEKVDPSLCNKLYRRELLKDSCLDASIQTGEDILRNFVLFQRAKRIVFEDFCGYQYWSRPNSMSNDARIISRFRQMVRGRKCILDHAGAEEIPCARRAWMSTLVTAVNQLTFLEEEEAQAFCEECRDQLRRNRRYIFALVRSQQLAARLILVSLGLHRIIYRIYQHRS